ncbi:MAG TPA: outer membrane beta-barrel protein [Polyangia bacterium]|nr:outer membrane beta-barrel protein [Polyangia bacterium]
MRILARTLGITALMMAPAFSALAQEPPPPAATEPPAATAPAPVAAAPAMAGTGGFGSLGQIAISVDLPFTNEAPQLALVHRSVSMGGGSDTYFAIRPSADYFVAPNISVGGQIGYTHGTTTAVGQDLNVFEIEIRGGYNLWLNDQFSIYPHLGIEYAHISSSYGGMSASGYAIPLIVTVPVLWHPAPHFFLGLAPTLTTELAVKFQSIDQPKETDIGVSAVIGGYFGGV